VARICAAISETTDRRGTNRDAAEVVMQLNRMMTGWANYFCLGPVSRVPITRWTNTPATGCVNGCARSTRLQDGQHPGSPMRTCTSGWGSFTSAR
jgi:hypothetical protein